MKKTPCSTVRGFTLVEMLLVAALLAGIGAVLYRSLVHGVAVWHRLDVASPEEDVLILFDRMGQDLRNARPYSLIPFKGTQRKCAFATVVPYPADPLMGIGNKIVPQVGEVIYQFSAQDGAVVRRQSGYGEALSGKGGSQRTIIRGLEDFKVLYVLPSDDGEEIRKDSDDRFPSAVRVQVQFRDESGRSRSMARLIEIPCGATRISLGET